MAVTTVRQGQVDPTPAQLQGGGNPLDLSCHSVRVTSSSSGDYSSGLAVASVLTACGLNAIVQAVGAVYASNNAFKGVAVYDVTSGKIRGYASTTEITAANGDYYDLIVVGT